MKLKNPFRKVEVAHICFTCVWFRSEKPGGNRYCKFPGKLNTQGNLCLSWQLEPVEQKRVYSIIDESGLTNELPKSMQSTTP